MSSAGSTPSIRVYESHRYSLPHHQRPLPHSQALAMAIPRARDDVPPPLPPPRHIEDLRAGQDPGWQWGNTNSPKDTGFGGNRLGGVRPGSSLYGNHRHQQPLHQESPAEYSFAGREPSMPGPFDDMSSENSGEHHSDEDRSGKSRPSLSNHRLTSERQLGQKALQSSSQAYDKQLLSKIGGYNSPSRTTASGSGNPIQDSPPDTPAAIHQVNGQLKPLSVPERVHTTVLPPTSKWPQSGALSPGHSGWRSPVFEASAADAHRGRFGSISTLGPLDEIPSYHRGSYDHNVFSDHEFGMEESSFRELNISDRSPTEGEDYHTSARGGLKRRASSPPSEAAREDRPITNGRTDLYHRRSAQALVNRNSSVSRFPMNPGSLSSMSSAEERNGSISSSFGISTAASSLTSYNGDQRVPPNAPTTASPLRESETTPITAYGANKSPNRSPRSGPPRTQHRRGISDTEHAHIRRISTDNVIHSQPNSIANRIPGAYICECCPKKPKKFDNEDELRLHELEKQYICQYCPNRFKNKNEAERHQNSLHLRRHSWSCAALVSVHAAFHPSPARPTIADICGYCGDEFPNPADWDVRSEHLNHVHKFGECNQAKKFFRADHFRQHLKHSHAGTSGKWTNLLENACMKDEPLPQERTGSISSVSGLLSASFSNKGGVIDEILEEN